MSVIDLAAARRRKAERTNPRRESDTANAGTRILIIVPGAYTPKEKLEAYELVMGGEQCDQIELDVTHVFPAPAK